jgi:ElaB/YqjD/DUF883 family membrane-anchored ribosome-binding protein
MPEFDEKVGQAANDVADRISGAAENAGQAAEDAGRTAHEAASSFGDRAAGAVHAAKDFAGHVKERASATLEQGYETAKAWEVSVEETMRRRPISTLLVAVGVGVLAGMIIGRATSRRYY